MVDMSPNCQLRLKMQQCWETQNSFENILYTRSEIKQTAWDTRTAFGIPEGI
jgi:hypothetical protein